MQVDIDGACRIARLATELDWTWYYDTDIPQLCRTTGWEITRSAEYGAEIRTDLRIQRPTARISKQKRIVKYLTILVTDVLDEEVPWDEVQRQMVDAFADLSAELMEVLGEPVRRKPGIDSEIGWDEQNVSINLVAAPQAIHLSLDNPEY
ncbi:hypothetical protein IU429_29380 [Nocardia elegans]|uniref:DUF6301 family protein n=1 Tax=Nocardia elegans TaxID=300029 RepID=A0ABW6TL34_9NOCA|nr:DUF6301 family protein [Nocardia elegans]MBF6451781.1 hypothetical protein [Nocardia elegans]